MLLQRSRRRDGDHGHHGYEDADYPIFLTIKNVPDASVCVITLRITSVACELTPMFGPTDVTNKHTSIPGTGLLVTDGLLQAILLQSRSLLHLGVSGSRAEEHSALPVGEEAEVADAHETAREQV
jgi:hypothetical protein